jgi:DNA-binding CsgD family transcriptional regulator
MVRSCFGPIGKARFSVNRVSSISRHGGTRYSMLNAVSLSNFVDHLGSETDLAGVWARTCKFFANQDLPWVCYGYTEMDRNAALTVPALKSNIRGDFLNRWLEEDLCGEDPSVRHTVSSLHCSVFGSEFMTRDESSKAVWEFYCDLREIGSYSFLAVPVRHNARWASGFLEIGGAFKANDMVRYLSECQDRLALAAHYADQRLADLTRAEDVAAVNLSPRERQCLQWLAKGSRNDRIADVLGIAQPTVKLHLQNARRKLHASTREQAIARAVYLGLIEP